MFLSYILNIYLNFYYYTHYCDLKKKKIIIIIKLNISVKKAEN